MTPRTHAHAREFLDLMARTQAAYESRDLYTYLSAFSADYTSAILDSEWWEDRTRLEQKMRKDHGRFELLSMDFEIKRHWYAGDIGFAHLGYVTRLRFKDSGRVLLDKRENIIVGRHQGAGEWKLINKIVLKAESLLEDDSAPEI